MAGNNRVDSGHGAAPLATDLVIIGVAGAAKEDFNLHVAFGRIASGDRRAASGDVALQLSRLLPYTYIIVVLLVCLADRSGPMIS